MSKAPAFQLYAADFYMDISGWDNDEVGIYLRLLLHQWVNGFIPSDLRSLSKIAQEKVQKFEKKWKKIEQKFIKNSEGNFINLRMENEHQKQLKYRELQSQKGKISAEVRATAVEPSLNSGCNRKSTLHTSSSSSNKRKKYIKKEKISDDGFLQTIKETFSWVDFELEIKKMDLWLSNNPTRKKTRRFILNWFNRKEKPLSINPQSKTQIEGGRAIKTSYDCHNCKKTFKEYQDYLTHKCEGVK